jgi:micrococcal nuclease
MKHSITSGRGRLLSPKVLVVVLLWLPMVAWGAVTEISGKVIHIVDGDTFDVLDSRHETTRIRVSCMDTPEKGQPFYRRAKDALADLIHGRQVLVKAYKHDRYGRLIGELADLDICHTMIATGMAWHNQPYARELAPGRADLLIEAEQGAKVRRAGVWTDTSPQPPWEFRRQQREAHSR